MFTSDSNKYRLHKDSKLSLTEEESTQRFVMSSQTTPATSKYQSINVDPSIIRHSPIKVSNSQSHESFFQSDVTTILLELKQMLHFEIDYTIKATIDQYEQEINKLTNENQKLRDDLISLDQYGSRDLMRINGAI